MQHTTLLSILILAASASSLARSADDLTVVSRVTTNGQPSGTEIKYISSDHIRTSRSQGTDLIIDLNSGVMTNIDEKKKTYYVVTRQDMEDLQAKMAARMSDPRMKQAMNAMQGMGASMASSAEVKKTGATRKVAGFTCDDWAITMGQMMTMTECVTSDLKYPVQSWKALADFNESMRKSMSGPGASAGADFAEKMKSIKGFPIATSVTVEAGPMKTTNTSEVTEVRHTPILASTWDVPAGFAKVDNPMKKAFQEHGH
jgi:hypothetical protein